MLTSAYSRAAALQSYCTHKNRGQTWYLTPVVSSSLPPKTQQTTFFNSQKAVTIQAPYLYNFVSFILLSYRAFPTGEKVVIVNKFKAKFSTLLKPRLRERMVTAIFFFHKPRGTCTCHHSLMAFCFQIAALEQLLQSPSPPNSIVQFCHFPK